MKTMMMLFLILITLPAHSAPYDQFEIDRYTYALRCGNEWISSVRYQWIKSGIHVPNTMGSVKEVVQWMTDKVKAKNARLYIRNKSRTDAFGNHYPDTVDAERLVTYIKDTLTRYGMEAVEWREKQGINKQSLGLPDKIDDCIVEPLWAVLEKSGARINDVLPSKVIGRQEVFLSLDPIDQVLLFLAAHFRRLENTNYEFALIFADNNATALSKIALLEILKNSPHEYFRLKSGIEVMGCVETSAGEEGDIKCSFARFFKGSQEPFRRYQMGSNENDAEKINELKSKYYDMDQNMFFTDDGRIISMPAGRLTSTYSFSLVRRPLYEVAGHSASWMQISGFTHYKRKILFDKDGTPRLEPNAEDDKAIEASNKRYEERQKEIAKENAENERTRKKCVIPNGQRCKQ